MGKYPSSNGTSARNVQIVDVFTQERPRALARDTRGGQYVIDLVTLPPGLRAVPNTGEEWWIKRHLNEWHLDSKVEPNAVRGKEPGSTLQVDIVQLEGRIDDLEISFSNMQIEINSIDERVVTLEENQDKIQDDIGWIKEGEGKVPNTPNITDITSDTYVDPNGDVRAYIQVSWAEPTYEDGTEIVSARYHLRWRVGGNTTYRGVTIEWGDNSYILDNISPGEEYHFQIQVIDEWDVSSDYSIETSHQVAFNETAPPKPHVPESTGGPLSVIVKHNLQDNLSNPLPIDLKHLEVHISTVDGFVPDSSTIVGVLSADKGMIEAGVTAVGNFNVDNDSRRYVRVIAVNTSDVRSDYSDESVADPRLVGGVDLEDDIIENRHVLDRTLEGRKLVEQAIDSTEILDRAILGNKLVLEAITNGELADLAVDLAKLDNDAIGDERLFVDGVIRGDFIQSNTVSTRNLLVGSFDNLINDPTFVNDFDEWISNNIGSIETTRPVVRVNIASLQEGYIQANGVDSDPDLHPTFSSDGDEFEVKLKVTCSGVGEEIDPILLVKDVNGVTLETINTGWTVAPTTWQELIFNWQTTSPDIAYVVFRINIRGGSSDGWIDFQDFHLRRKVPGNLIVDGSISANQIGADQINASHIIAEEIDTVHLNADAITSAKIAAEQILTEHIFADQILAEHISGQSIEAEHLNANIITGNEIIAGSISADDAVFASAAIVDADIANLTAGKIASGEITVGTEIKSANFVSAPPGDNSGAGWLINGDGYMELQDAIVRGQLNADDLVVGTLSPDRIAANTIVTEHLSVGVRIETDSGTQLGQLSSSWSGLRLDSSSYSDVFMKDNNGRRLIRMENSGGSRVFDFDSDRSTALVIRGDAEFRGTLNGVSGDFSGYLNADNGFIGGIDIDSGRLESNYSSTSGFRIYDNGNATFNDITARGIIDNSRLKIDSSTIDFYDSGGGHGGRINATSEGIGIRDPGGYRIDLHASGLTVYSSSGATAFTSDTSLARSYGDLRADGDVYFGGSAYIHSTGSFVYIYASGGANAIRLGTGGSVSRIYALSDNSTSNSGNVYSTTSGSLYRSTSSVRYKFDIEDVDSDYNRVLDLRPVWHRSLSKVDPSKWSYWGFLAEEVSDIDPRLVHYDDNNHPDGIQYDKIAVLLQQKVKEHEDIILNLQREIQELKERV